MFSCYLCIIAQQEEEDEGNEEGRYFLGAQESTKEGCVVDEKVKLIKLGVALATPVAGKNLSCLDRSKLPQATFHFSPSVVLRGMVGCGNQAWRGAATGKAIHQKASPQGEAFW